MIGGYQFRELVALEDAAAREEVIGFAEEIHESDLRAWEKACAAADLAGKPRPQRTRASQDRAWCREKSREIRVKRERHATYFNQLTAANPQY